MSELQTTIDLVQPGEEEMYDRAVSQPLEFKIKRAIGLLRMYEKRAVELDPEFGYYLCFSGGKDSCVAKQLCIEAGVKFAAHYNQTTIDPPEQIKFLREHHPDTIWEWQNTRKIGFFQELVLNGPPKPTARWCCRRFKEGGGAGKFKIVGVRAPESVRRKRLWREQQTKLGAEYLAPICYWTDKDVWDFIHLRNLPYCSLYDEGFDRVGCIACPLASREEMWKWFARYPKYEAAFKRAIFQFAKRRQERIDAGTFRGDTTKPRMNGEQEWEAFYYQTFRKHSKKSDVCVYQEMIEQMGGVTSVEMKAIDDAADE